MKSCQRSPHYLVQQKILWRSCWHPLRGPCIIFHRSLWEDLVEILFKSSLGGLCMILYKSLTEDLAEILVLVRSSLRGPCMKILQMPCIWGACVKALVGGFWEVLVSRSSKIRSSSSRSFHGDIVTFSSESWREDLGQGLVQVRVRRSYGHPSEMLSEALAWSCTGPSEKILKRSCWNPPLEVLALRSWRCSALVLVWKFFWDAHRNFLYEDLLRSCT